MSSYEEVIVSNLKSEWVISIVNGCWHIKIMDRGAKRYYENKEEG